MTKPYSPFTSDERRLRSKLEELREPPCVHPYGLAVRMSSAFKMNALIYWSARPSVVESIDFEMGEDVDWQAFVQRFNNKVRKQKEQDVSNDVNEVKPISAREAAEVFQEKTLAVESAWSQQIGGAHYKKRGIQPMHYSMANGLDGCQHTIVKYVTRFREKGGIEDLKKARHVLDMLIEWEEKGGAI